MNYIKVVPIVSVLILVAGCMESPKNQLQIMFAGDTMLGRLTNETINQKGYTYPWGNILPIIKKADLRIVNLETTFTKSSKKVPKVFNYKADPKNVQALVKANINVVSLANNHSKDFGNEGLLETIKTLDEAHILHVGAGRTILEARKPVIIEKQGIKVGIIGATDNEPTWQATGSSPGINFFTVYNLSELLDQIKHLTERVDFVVVSLHWGPNMRQRPTKEYIDAAHKMIDAGADIIHGHSAHIFQGVAMYKNKLIMYDTGDFVDDYRVDPVLRNDQGLLFFVTINKGVIKQADLIPTLISNMQVNLAHGTEKKEITEKIKKLSAELGTTISDDGNVSVQ